MSVAAVNTGTNISITAHAALILWALIGGWFLQASDPIQFSSTEVSLFSSEEYEALFEDVGAPAVVEEVSSLVPVVLDEAAPVIEASEPDVAPEPVADTFKEPSPEVVEEQPVVEETAPPPPIEPTPPVPDAPPAEETQIVNEDFAAQSTPFEAQKIESLPTPQPEQDAPVADTTTPAVVEEAVAEQVEEAKPATVQEQTTTEIVTEAEKPASSVMEVSARPMLRPTPKVVEPKKEEPKPVETVKPEENKPDPIAAALAEATATPSAPATPLPIGSRLSAGEEDAFRLAVKECWNVGTASTEVLSTKITVALSMSRDGKPDVGSIRMLNFTGGTSDAAATAFRMAKSALVRCGANGYKLPSDKYDQWQNIEITFNPEKMRTK